MLIPVILCGGAGTRLWPVSREAHPKPFMRLADGQSLLQKTLLRASALPDVEVVLTVSSQDFYFQTEDHYRAVLARPVMLSYLLEPCGRNTAPAIAAAALEVAQRWGRQAQMLVLAADHVIAEQDAFVAAVCRAREMARQGFLVTFGMQPSSPETGFGYIERGEWPLGDEDVEGKAKDKVYPVSRFVEKPNLATATAYLASERFFWNSGMFCFTAGAVLDGLEQHAVALVEGVRDCRAASRVLEQAGGGFIVELDTTKFAAVPGISIDYALMEKTQRAAVVCCEMAWSDIGSWDALGKQFPADARGNVLSGEVLLEDADNCFIQSEGRLVGALGVNNLLIVDTPDALLVAHRDRAQDVKNIASRLKHSGHEAHRLHRTVHRPWGSYTVLEEGPRFKIKRLVVKPGGSLSLQKHRQRSEHWIVVSGVARVDNDGRQQEIGVDQSTYIPAGIWHRLSNPAADDLVIIEVQSGDYLGEDDIERAPLSSVGEVAVTRHV